MRASEIPDGALRSAALDALRVKRTDLEGAVAFATCTPTGAHRQTLTRAITAWEIAFDYLDTISEMPNPHPVANGQALNRALVSAFMLSAAHPDYYALHVYDSDAGYLVELVDTCRGQLMSLPAFDLIAEPALRGLSRIVAYQSLNHGDADGSHAAFLDWARSQTVPGAGLHWWETGAAAGSQLTILALMSAAANPRLTVEHVMALEDAYFPWVGALSTLLDALIDQPLDNAEGQPNPIDHYDSPEQTAERLEAIASEAVARVRELPDAEHHALLMAAMAASFYVQARSRTAQLAMEAVLSAMGRIAVPALAVFKVRHAHAVLASLGKRRDGTQMRRVRSAVPSIHDR